MALQKEITRGDGTTGNYIRLVSIQFPNYDKQIGVGKCYLGFNIYKDLDAAKVSNLDIFSTLSIQVDYSFFETLPESFDLAAKWVYEHKALIEQLADAEDVLDEEVPENE